MKQDGTVASELRRQRRGLARGVAAGLAVLIAGLGVLVVRVDPAVTRTQQSTRLVTQLVEGMLDEETGLRGFLLTDNRTFLSPYQSGLASVTGARMSLAGAPDSSRGLKAALAQTLAAVDAWQDSYAQPAVAAPATAVGNVAGDARGKLLFDAFRRSVASLSAAAQSSADTALDRQRWFLIGGLVYAMLTAAALMTTVAVQGRRLDRWIGRPIAELDAAVGAMRGRTEVAEQPREAPQELRRVWSNLAELGAELVTEREARRSRDSQLAATARRSAQLLELTQDFAGSLDAADIRQHLEVSAARLTFGGALLVDIEPGTHRVLYGQQVSAAVPDAARRRMPVFRNSRGTHVLAVPLIIVDQDCSAVLQLDLDTDDIDPDLVTAVSTLCSHAATALTAARLHEEIATASRLDALTGLANRRTFDVDIAGVVGLDTTGGDTALLMIDVDHFKRVNDTQGHQAGDEVLRLVARALVEAARPSDTVYRYGGEEFAVLLPATHMLGAAACGRRLREHVAHTLADQGVTVSIGVACLGPRDNALALIARTDRALYEAKSAGRNRVATA